MLLLLPNLSMGGTPVATPIVAEVTWSTLQGASDTYKSAQEVTDTYKTAQGVTDSWKNLQ